MQETRSWLFQKSAPYREFVLYEVVLRWHFLVYVALAAVATLALAVLLALIPTSSVWGLAPSLQTSVLWLPLWAWTFLAVLAICTALDARIRWRAHEHGPAASGLPYPDRVVFAGFYEAGSSGRLCRSNRSLSLERAFSSSLRDELSGHRLNSSGVQLAGRPVRVDLIDWRAPRGFAEAHDQESFRPHLRRIARGSAGVIWGTVAGDGTFATFEVVGEETNFHGGPIYAEIMNRICTLAEVRSLRTPNLASLIGKVLAGFYGMAYCDPIGDEGRPLQTLPLLDDSKRLVRETLEQLHAENPENENAEVARVADRLEKLLLPLIVRQEAWGLRVAGQEEQALERLVEALEIDLFTPFDTEGEYKLFLESTYNHSTSQLAEQWRLRLGEQQRASDPAYAQRFRERALADYPPPSLDLLPVWIGYAHSEELDSETLTEALFERLARRYPANAFVHYYWGEARRVVSLVKYGTAPGSPHVPSLDRAIEQFQKAREVAPEFEIAAVRIGGLLITSAFGMEKEDEMRRRLNTGFETTLSAQRYLEANMPEWLPSYGVQASYPDGV